MKQILRLVSILITGVWASASVEAQKEIKIQQGHNVQINQVAFSNDGKYVLTASYDQTSKLWEIASGKEIRCFAGHSSSVQSVCFSQNGRFVLTGSADNTAKLWDIKTGKEIHTFTGHSRSLRSVACSPDGKYVLTGSDDQLMKLWDIATAKEVQSFKNTFIVHQVGFSSDGKYAFSNAGSNLKVYDVASGKELQSLDTKAGSGFGRFTSGSFVPNSHYLLTVRNGGKMKISVWDILTGNEISKTEWSSKSIFALSPDCRSVMVAGLNNTFELWDPFTGQKTKTFTGYNDTIFSVAVSNNGKYFLAGYKDNTARLYDISSGNQIKIFKGHPKHIGHPAWGRSVGFIPGDRYIYSNALTRMKIWEISTDWTVGLFQGITTPINSAAISPDGKYAASVSDSNSVSLWDLTRGSLIRNYSGHTARVFSVCFSPDGKYILSGSEDKTLKLWDVYSGELVKTLVGHDNAIIQVAFSPSGKYAFSIAWDNKCILWEISTGKLVRNYEWWGGYGILSFVFSPDENNIITVSPDALKSWDVNSGKAILQFKDQFKYVIQENSVAVSPDGKLVLSKGRDSSQCLKLWSVQTGDVVRSFNYSDRIYSVAFSPDGKQALSNGSGGSIIFWDIQKGSILRSFYGHTSLVTSLSFSPDGKYFLSGSKDGTIRYWKIQTGELLFTATSTQKGESLCWTPEGYFSGSEKLAKEAVYIVDGMNVIGIDQLFETYYRPDLVMARIKGEDISRYSKATIQQGLKLPPLVKITSPASGADLSKGLTNIAVEVTDQGGGIDEIRLYHNGKLIDGTLRGFKPVTGNAGKQIKTFSLTLVNGENHIKATAFNMQRTESLPDEITVHYTSAQPAKSNMYVLAVGINQYLNPRYNLNYACNDAEAFVQALKTGATPIFGKVEVTTIYDLQATRVAILAAIDAIKGKAGAEDVFVFYYAGHGVMSSVIDNDQSMYYLVPHDVTKMYEADEMLKAKGISAKEIKEFSKNIKAQKQLFVLDACQSGGAVQTFAMRGAGEERAIAQLARSTGTYFIAASGTEQFATEVATLGHGIFTYSVIEALKGSCKSQDGRITVNILKGCVENLVPELSKQHKGQPQFPTGYGYGQDFPLGVVK